MDVSHALAIPKIARLEHVCQVFARERWDSRPYLRILCIDPRPKSYSVPGRDSQELGEIRRQLRAATDGQKVDDLNEQPRLTAARTRSRSPGRNRSCPICNDGPLGTSRAPSSTMGIPPPRVARTFLPRARQKRAPRRKQHDRKCRQGHRREVGPAYPDLRHAGTPRMVVREGLEPSTSAL